MCSECYEKHQKFDYKLAYVNRTADSNENPYAHPNYLSDFVKDALPYFLQANPDVELRLEKFMIDYMIKKYNQYVGEPVNHG